MRPDRMGIGLKFRYVVSDNHPEARAMALKELGFKSMPFSLDYDDEVKYKNDMRKYGELYEQYHCVNYSEVTVIGMSKSGRVIDVEDDAGNVFKFNYRLGRYEMIENEGVFLTELDLD